MNLRETENCPNLRECPIDGEWTNWMKTADCNVTCGEGKEVKFLRLINKQSHILQVKLTIVKPKA